MIATRIGRSRLAAVLLALGSTAPAWADNAQGPLATINTTDHWIWITVYDVTKTIHIDYGWVPPCRARTWNNFGWRGFVRAEVKGSRDASRPPGDTPNVFDTTIKSADKFNVTLVGSGGSYHLTYDMTSQYINCRVGGMGNENCCTGQSDGGYTGAPF